MNPLPKNNRWKKENFSIPNDNNQSNGGRYQSNRGRYQSNRGRYQSNRGRYQSNRGRYQSNRGRYQTPTKIEKPKEFKFVNESFPSLGNSKPIKQNPILNWGEAAKRGVLAPDNPPPIKTVPKKKMISLEKRLKKEEEEEEEEEESIEFENDVFPSKNGYIDF